jgi:hypothetical protein
MLDDLQAQDDIEFVVRERHLLGVHDVAFEPLIEVPKETVIPNVNSRDALEAARAG